MKGTELRIGNAVIKQGKQRFVTPSDISTTASDGMIDYLKPVPLTPEILQAKDGILIFGKFQFVIKKITKELYCPAFYFSDQYIKSKPGTFLGCEHAVYIMPVHINYLHQFQNLIFDLTGEELQCNL